MTTEKLAPGNLPESYCHGKARIPSYALAQVAARRGSRRTESRRQPYKCHHCGDWHVGTGLAPKGTRGRPRDQRQPENEEAEA